MSTTHGCVAWIVTLALGIGAQGCGAEVQGVGVTMPALETAPLIITEIAQATSYGGSTADKVEVFCAATEGCPPYRVCDPTSGGGTSCSAVQSALGAGARAVLSRGTSITAESYEQLWIEDCTGSCAEMTGSRVAGPFACPNGESLARADCPGSFFAECATPDLGSGISCSSGGCGDLECSTEETCSSCPSDCGVCTEPEPFDYTLTFARNQHGSASTTCTSTMCADLEALIDGASTSIDFAIYGIRGQQAILDALLNAEARGVAVRGVVDSENNACGAAGSYTYPDTVALVESLGPGAVGCDNGSGYGYIMHNKFFVFDRQTVWTGSTNVSDTGTGGELNANVVATIHSTQLASIYTSEFEEMYGGAFHHNKVDNTQHALGSSNWTDGTTIVESYFAPTDDANTYAMLQLIDGANSTLDVAIFYLTDDAIGDALVAAHLRGVSVRVVIDATGASSSGTEKDKLCTAGVPLKVENWPGKQHGKWAVADSAAVVFGSQNWTAAGNGDNDENTLYVQNAAFANEFSTEFARQWADLATVANCAATAAEGSDSPGTCNDGSDNDYDGYTDCDDSGCSADPVCATLSEGTPTACNDGVDNDGDSYLDCNDFDCADVGICALVVNECLPRPVSGLEWIELWNPTDVDVDASGALVDDISGGSSPQLLGAGSVVPAHGALMVALSSNKLNNSGADECRLLDINQTQIDSLAYSNAPPGSSWGRLPDATGAATWHTNPTPGASNQ